MTALKVYYPLMTCSMRPSLLSYTTFGRSRGFAERFAANEHSCNRTLSSRSAVRSKASKSRGSTTVTRLTDRRALTGNILLNAIIRNVSCQQPRSSLMTLRKLGMKKSDTLRQQIEVKYRIHTHFLYALITDIARRELICSIQCLPAPSEASPPRLLIITIVPDLAVYAYV